MQIDKILRKLGSRNMMVMSDCRPEVEIWPYRACAMKNMQYKPYLMADYGLGYGVDTTFQGTYF